MCHVFNFETYEFNNNPVSGMRGCVISEEYSTSSTKNIQFKEYASSINKNEKYKFNDLIIKVRIYPKRSPYFYYRLLKYANYLDFDFDLFYITIAIVLGILVLLSVIPFVGIFISVGVYLYGRKNKKSRLYRINKREAFNNLSHI